MRVRSGRENEEESIFNPLTPHTIPNDFPIRLRFWDYREKFTLFIFLTPTPWDLVWVGIGVTIMVGYAENNEEKSLCFYPYPTHPTPSDNKAPPFSISLTSPSWNKWGKIKWGIMGKIVWFFPKNQNPSKIETSFVLKMHFWKKKRNDNKCTCEYQGFMMPKKYSLLIHVECFQKYLLSPTSIIA